MNDILSGLVAGFTIMACIATYAVGTSTAFVEYKRVQAIVTECEKNLPRNENCVIVALPKSVD